MKFYQSLNFFLIVYLHIDEKKATQMSGIIHKWCLEIDSNYRPYGYEPYALAN